MITRPLIGIYRQLPVKPFRGILERLYGGYRSLNRNMVVIAKVNGIKYQLNLHELIDSSIYYEGVFEPMTAAVIDKYVKKGMAVLDIGANIGCHTLRLAKLVGQNGRVIAFEPMSYALSKLKRNIELNDFNNIVLEIIALSDINQRKKSTYFRSSWPLDGSAPHVNQMEDIDFITLDDYIERNKIDGIDFIKLDVDGYEYKVIRGGVHSLKY